MWAFVFCYSKSTDRWVEEDAAREVRIIELSEWGLLLEVPLDGRVIVRLHRLVEGLVCRLELIIVNACALAEAQRLG